MSPSTYQSDQAGPVAVRLATVGISPKVSIPTLVLMAVGVALIIAGEKDTGLTLVLAAAGVGGLGAVAKPGEVVATPVNPPGPPA